MDFIMQVLCIYYEGMYLENHSVAWQLFTHFTPVLHEYVSIVNEITQKVREIVHQI